MLTYRSVTRMGYHITFLTLLLLILLVRGAEKRRVEAQAPLATFTTTFTCCVYTPPETTIMVGDTMTWVGSFAQHPLVSEDGLWATQTTGTEFSYTFLAAGSYRFYCDLHGAPGGLGMSGQIIVTVPHRVYLPAIQK